MKITSYLVVKLVIYCASLSLIIYLLYMNVMPFGTLTFSCQFNNKCDKYFKNLTVQDNVIYFDAPCQSSIKSIEAILQVPIKEKNNIQFGIAQADKTYKYLPLSFDNNKTLSATIEKKDIYCQSNNYNMFTITGLSADIAKKSEMLIKFHR